MWKGIRPYAYDFTNIICIGISSVEVDLTHEDSLGLKKIDES